MGFVVLKAPFVGWLYEPIYYSGVPEGEHYTCSGDGSVSSVSGTRGISMDTCLCCNADDTLLAADIVTCPIMNVVTSEKPSSTPKPEPGAAHTSSLLEYFLYLSDRIAIRGDGVSLVID